MESKLLYKTFLVHSSALGVCCWALPWAFMFGPVFDGISTA